MEIVLDNTNKVIVERKNPYRLTRGSFQIIDNHTILVKKDTLALSEITAISVIDTPKQFIGSGILLGGLGLATASIMTLKNSPQSFAGTLAALAGATFSTVPVIIGGVILILKSKYIIADDKWKLVVQQNIE